MKKKSKTSSKAAIAKKPRLAPKASFRYVLTAEDAKLFQAALDMPPPPTPRALKAAKSYRRHVLHAD